MHLVASVRLGNVPGSRRHPQIRKSFPCGSAGKESACSAGDLGSIPRLGRSPEEGNGNLLQYSCLENPMEEPGRLLSMGHKESDMTEQPTLSLSLQLEKLEKLWAWFQGWRVSPRSVCTHRPQGGAATPSTLGPGQGFLGLMRGTAPPGPPHSDERGRDPDLCPCRTQRVPTISQTQLESRGGPSKLVCYRARGETDGWVWWACWKTQRRLAETGPLRSFDSEGSAD